MPISGIDLKITTFAFHEKEPFSMSLLLIFILRGCLYGQKSPEDEFPRALSCGSVLVCMSATRECHARTSFHTVARISCRCKTSASCKKGRTTRFCMKSASWRTGTISACANFHNCAYMSISFPEPTCLLVSAKTRCLGADQKTREQLGTRLLTCVFNQLCVPSNYPDI